MNGVQATESSKVARPAFLELVFGLGLVWDGVRYFMTSGPKLNPPANTSERVTLDVWHIIFLLVGAWLVSAFLRAFLKSRERSSGAN
jgi:hypothetical protein